MQLQITARGIRVMVDGLGTLHAKQVLSCATMDALADPASSESLSINRSTKGAQLFQSSAPTDTQQRHLKKLRNNPWKRQLQCAVVAAAAAAATAAATHTPCRRTPVTPHFGGLARFGLY